MRQQEKRPIEEPKDEYAELIALLKQDKKRSYYDDVVEVLMQVQPCR